MDLFSIKDGFSKVFYDRYFCWVVKGLGKWRDLS